MADLRLESFKGGMSELPDVCMVCGAPATLRKRKKFSWFPPWIWILLFCSWLPFLIVALVLTKRRTIDVPLCEEHKNHWLWRQLLVYGSLFGVILVGVVAGIAMNENEKGGDVPLSDFLCGGTVILLIVWVILAVVVQVTSIRVKEITDRNIKLSGVAPEFVEAYEQAWHIEPERLDSLAREHWNDPHRASRGGNPTLDDDDRIQPGDDDDRRPPPDSFQEGTR
jgi:hypothetical protein